MPTASLFHFRFRFRETMMPHDMTPIRREDRFGFFCGPGVRCFNACCRDLNQFLTPYDILRLKNGLKMTSTTFLQEYCTRHVGPRSGLPIVTLTPADSHERQCPFLTPRGCGVYADRPSSCRMYPLVRAVSRSRETGEMVEQYAVLREPHCLGFDPDAGQTVDHWICRQGLDAYNVHNDMLMEIISLKNRHCPGPLDADAGRFFSLACYDLDAFRMRVFENNILRGVNVDSGMREAARSSDEALLKLGMTAVREVLFGGRS